MWQRIKGVVLQEFYVTRRSLEIILDIFFFSLVAILVFGLVNRFLLQTASSEATTYLFIGVVLWEVVRVAQYSMSTGSMWNIWSHNLSNMFIAPLSVTEYLFSHMVSAALKALIVFVASMALALVVFGLDLFALGFGNLSLFFVNLTIFSWTLGIALIGLIFAYGTRIQAIAWGAIFLFQPLTAAYFPVSVLPVTLQGIAYLLPPTYVFEAARMAFTDPTINWSMAGTALLLNIIYFLLSIWFFAVMYRRSRETGQFARNDA